MRVLFLDASDDVLIRRYEGTRRRHPLAARGVEESIADERRLLAPVRDQADLLIDTGELNTNQLRSRVLEAFGDEGGASSMRTSVVSFGYKYGLPLDVDVVFDCRFLPNPFWIEELRPFSGLDDPGARLRPRPARDEGLPREGRRAADRDPPVVRAGGEVLPDHRPRVHRGPAPLGGAGRGAGRAASASTAIRCRSSTADVDR